MVSFDPERGPGRPLHDLTVLMLDRFLPALRRVREGERARLLAMVGLYFLVLFPVGMLRPIRNAFALDGLEKTDFYQVYLVSAVVILAVPPFNRLANRVRWHVLIPAVAALFAVSLVVLRLLYVEGSTTFGLVFYGYYDLFAAALVTQFFMAIQLFFNASDAKSAIPLVIIGGSLGATCGGFATGLLSKPLGAPNLLMVAAVPIAAFAAALPFVWAGHQPVERRVGKTVRKRSLFAGDFFRVFSNRHIRLIAGLVLITILVKTMVDYEFNEATALYAGNRDAISSLQGWFTGGTQWLPVLVLLGLRPVLKRWGVGMVVLVLPLIMFLSTLGLALAFGIVAALTVKGCDTAFRYSVERTAREVLYVPVPTDLKLRAKAYIDMALEKGLAKVLAAVVIFILIQRMSLVGLAWAIAVLCVVWMIAALAVRRRYVATLRDAIRGRFASVEGSFATLTERSALAFVEDALRGDPVQAAFALDLIEQAGRVDAEPLADEMELLLGHGSADLRERVLRLLARFPGLVGAERIEERLADPASDVRRAAVAALAASDPRPGGRERILAGLVRSPEPGVRHATLTALVRGDVPCDRSAVVGDAYVREPLGNLGNGDRALGPPDDREELALALGLLNGGPPARDLLQGLLQDPEPRVVRAALTSAGAAHRVDLLPTMIAALAEPGLRREAREAVAAQGPQAVPMLAAWLVDPDRPAAVRRQIPAVMARIRSQDCVDALLRALAEPQAEPDVELQILKALNKLRTGAPPEEGLAFDPAATLPVVYRAAEEARRCAAQRARLVGAQSDGHGVRLLCQALTEAHEGCRERVFRCLGLAFPPDAIHRAYVTLTQGGERARANAIEWLNETVGHDVFVRIEPVLKSRDAPARQAAREPTDVTGTLSELESSPDAWVAELAAWNLRSPHAPHPDDGSETMDRIEKLFLLQKVDLLQGAKSSHLALLASIAEEVEVERGEEIIAQGETNESLYVVIRGAIEVRGVRDQILVAGANTPFGTWALIDSDPSVVGARAAEASLLLRITRSDFQDLLAEHPELAVGMLQGLARRMRGLVA